MWLLEINSVGELFGRRAFGQGISERVWINVERLYLHGSVADPLKGNLMIDEVFPRMVALSLLRGTADLNLRSEVLSECASEMCGLLKSVSRT